MPAFTIPRRVMLMTAVSAAVIMGDSMIYNVLPSRVEAFGVSVGLVGVLLSANRVVRLASNSLAAWALERFGIVAPLTVAIVIAIGTTAAYGVGRGFAVLVAARVLWGIAFSVFRLTGYMVVIEESRDSNRGQIMGFFTSGVRSGSIFGVLAGGLLFDVAGKTASFLVMAGFGLLALPAVAGLHRRSDDEPRALAAASSTMPPSVSPHSDATTRDRTDGKRKWLWNVLVSPVPELSVGERRRVLTLCFTYFCFHLVMNGVLVGSLGYLLSQRLPSGATILGVALGIATLNGFLISTRWIAGLAAPFFGYLGDRHGREKIVAGAIPICVIGLALLAIPETFGAAVVWLPLAFGAVAAAITALDSTIGGLAPPRRRARVMSRYATWQDVGSAIGPLAAYAVIGFASLTLVYLTGAAVLVMALAVFLTVFRLSAQDRTSGVIGT
ncbi:MAG: MFS transporter [SAR202 cluster bacterium]|nr:MFS transporter [SAR202 cluster bacterium]